MKQTFIKLTIYTTLFMCTILVNLTSIAQCTINTSVSHFPTPNVCSGKTLTLSASTNVSGVSYSWTGPNNYTNNSANAVIPNVNNTHSGTYKVIVSKTGCTSDSDSVSITVHSTPTPPLQAQTPICSGDTLIIDLLQFPKNTTAIGWAPNGYSDTITLSPLKFPNAEKHTHSGEFKILASNAQCTSDTLRLIIPQYDIVYKPDTPVASVNKTPLCSGDTLMLSGNSSSAIDGYYWTGPNQQTYLSQNITINGYSVVGKQQFVLRTDSNGCFSVPATLDIDVYPIKTPSVSIKADPAFVVSPNVLVTLTAEVKDTGSNIQYQWRKNGVDINGETNKTLGVVTTQDIQQGDLISVWVKTTPSCAPIDTVLSNFVSVNITLDIDGLEQQKNLSIYPNPANNILTIESKERITDITIYNITGTRIDVHKDTDRINENKVHINTQELPSGVYLLKTNLGTYKFIKTSK